MKTSGAPNQKSEILYLADSNDWIANPLTSQVVPVSRLLPKVKVGLIKLLADRELTIMFDDSIVISDI